MNELSLGTVGQISRRVRDIDVSLPWYEEVLGLKFLYRMGNLAFFDLAGVRLFLSSADEAAGPVGESVIYFRVEDIHAAAAALLARGVTFTQAPHVIYRDETGVEEWMAFFTDPDGLALAVMSRAHSEGRAVIAIAPGVHYPSAP